MNRSRNVLGAWLLVLAGCSDAVTEVSPAALEVEPSSITLTSIGQTVQLTGTVRAGNGSALNRVVTWTSSDTTRVRVSAQGLVTAVANGSATVTAASGSLSRPVAVSVAQAASAVEISPSTITLAAIGQNTQLTAIVRDAGGSLILNAPVSWASSDERIVRVSASGMITALAAGQATITARSGAAVGTRVVTVTIPTSEPAPVSLPVLGNAAVTDRYTSEIAVAGNVAYTGTWSCRGGNCGNAVKVWNVAGNTPVLVDSLIIPGAGTTGDVQISDDGRLLVVANEYNPNGAITIFDLANPLRPTQLSRFSSAEAARGVHTVKLSRINGRHYAFLSINPSAGFAARLVIADITDPRNPTQVYQAMMGQPYVHDVFVRDGILFTALWDAGLTLWDVGGGGLGGSPSSPVQMGNVQTVGGDVHNVHWFHDPRTGAKKYAFVGQESPGLVGGLGRAGSTAGDIHVIDVSNLRAPRAVAFFHVDSAGVHNFAVDEQSGILYAAYYNAGIRALDIRGELGTCTALERAADGRCDLALMKRERGRALTDRTVSIWGVALQGNYLYASDMLNGLWKIDATALKR